MSNAQNMHSRAESSLPAPLRHRFVVLLGALTMLLFLAPFVHLLGPGSHSRLVMTVAFVALLLSAVLAVSQSRMTAIIAASLAAPVIVLQALNLWTERTEIGLTSQLLGIAFLGYTLIVILKFLFASDRVTIDTICASLCAYLVLGVLWSIAFSLLEMIDQRSFKYAFAEDGDGGSMRFGTERTVLALYYSFVTMTTLGYGDIVPASSAARMFAAIEAIMGQLYLAVLVARLVGLHISHETALNRDPGNRCGSGARLR